MPRAVSAVSEERFSPLHTTRGPNNAGPNRHAARTRLARSRASRRQGLQAGVPVLPGARAPHDQQVRHINRLRRARGGQAPGRRRHVTRGCRLACIRIRPSKASKNSLRHHSVGVMGHHSVGVMPGHMRMGPQTAKPSIYAAVSLFLQGADSALSRPSRSSRRSSLTRTRSELATSESARNLPACEKRYAPRPSHGAAAAAAPSSPPGGCTSAYTARPNHVSCVGEVDRLPKSI